MEVADEPCPLQNLSSATVTAEKGRAAIVAPLQGDPQGVESGKSDTREPRAASPMEEPDCRKVTTLLRTRMRRWKRQLRRKTLRPCNRSIFRLATVSSATDTLEAKQILLQHSLPKARQRTNVTTAKCTPSCRLFGAYTTRGEEIAQATYCFPAVVGAITAMAASRGEACSS